MTTFFISTVATTAISQATTGAVIPQPEHDHDTIVGVGQPGAGSNSLQHVCNTCDTNSTWPAGIRGDTGMPGPASPAGMPGKSR